jgi:hypothetical protein
MGDVKLNEFKLLDLVHHFSSGMKAIYSTEMVENLDKIRICLGGAGFSGWSGIPRFIEDNAPHPTHEGD